MTHCVTLFYGQSKHSGNLWPCLQDSKGIKDKSTMSDVSTPAFTTLNDLIIFFPPLDRFGPLNL